MLNLSKILKMTQDELLEKLPTELIDYENSILATDKYIFAKGTEPLLLVAHLDTVHKEPVKEIFYDKKQDVMWSPEGIGGDDRCGVFAILSIIEKGYRPYILFTTDEEIGGKGAEAFSKQYQFDLAKEIKYIVEIDRRGNKQAVFYKCGNQDFEKYILNFGFKKETGTFSDIGFLSPKYNIASVNLSAGYYNEHTFQEYIKVRDLNNTVQAIEKMLIDLENVDYFDYQEKTIQYTKKTFKYEDYYDESTEDRYLNIYDDWYELTPDEWQKKYKYKKPLTVSDLYK